MLTVHPDNLFLFFSGNEVINARNNTNAAPYIKAVTRDMKRYIGCILLMRR
jgi:hypothetical protein